MSESSKREREKVREKGDEERKSTGTLKMNGCPTHPSQNTFVDWNKSVSMRERKVGKTSKKKSEKI